MLKRLLFTLTYTILTVINTPIHAKQPFEIEKYSNQTSVSHKNKKTLESRVNEYKKKSFLYKLIISPFGGHYFHTGRKLEGFTTLAGTLIIIGLHIYSCCNFIETNPETKIKEVKKDKKIHHNLINGLNVGLTCMIIRDLIMIKQGTFKDAEGKPLGK